MKHLFLTLFAALMFAGMAWAGGWTRLTDVSQLRAGDMVVLACPYKSMTAGQLSNKVLVAQSSTFSSDTMTITSLAERTQVFILGGSEGAWTLANESGKLLGAKKAKELAWDEGTTTWAISISDDGTILSPVQTEFGRFLYNVNSPRFTIYPSDVTPSMVLPTLYIRSILKYTFEYADYPDKTTHCGIAEYIDGTKIILSKGTPTREDEVFVGWLYNDKLYAPGDEFVMPAENVALQAQWKKAMGFSSPQVPTQAKKVLRDGSLFLQVSNTTYDVLGNRISLK